MRAASQRAPRSQSRAIPHIVLCVSLLLTLAVTVSFAASARANDQLRFEREVQQTQDSIAARLDSYTSLLRGVAGLFSTSDTISGDEFRAYVERLGLAEHYPGIQGVGFSMRVTPSSEAALVDLLRRQGQPGFRIWPDGPRDETHTIIYLYPLNGRNRAALGYDMFSEPTRRAAMEQARDTGQPAASGRVTLVQEIDANKQSGFLIYVPVYRSIEAPDTVAERRVQLLGFAYSPFRINDLLVGIFTERTDPLVSFEIYDSAEPNPERLLYRSAAPATGNQPGFSTTNSLSVAGRPWTLRYTTRPSFTRSQTSMLVPLIGLFGLLMSFLLFALVESQVRARNQAEAAVRVRDDFFSVASHELKTPLTALLGNTQLLLRRATRTGTLPERDQRSLAVIAEQAQRLDKLLNALLDHSRIQGGRLMIDRAPLDLAALVRQVVDETRPSLSKHTLALDTPDTPMFVDGDDLRLTQVLQNVISNAIKYSPAGGPVEVRLAAEGGYGVIRVSDHGIGIPAAALPHVFEQFYRASNVDARSISGMGIGLHVIREIVSQHEGHVDVESAEGAGSIFTIRLPLAALPHPDAAASTAGDHQVATG